MTREEIHQRYQIPMELLKEYEERDLQKEKTDGRAKVYDDRDLLWPSRWMTLQKAGFHKRKGPGISAYGKGKKGNSGWQCWKNSDTRC
ncbi:MAG: hypothetical protein ACLUFF_06280 [Acutalibacteraceae bacterium]